MKYSKNVIASYEKIADWFDEHRSRDLFEKKWIDRALRQLEKNADVLDLGCGMGQPIAEYLVQQGCSVTGIDTNKKSIDKAKQRIPKAHFMLGDMRTISLDHQFDLVIAWHSFFHLTQLDQRAMFPVFKNHLKNGGILLFTSGPKEGEVWSDNGGEMLYHASLSLDTYRALLLQYQFDLIDYQVEDPQCGDATIWMAQLL